MRRCPGRFWKSSRTRGISRSTTTLIASSRSSSGSSTRPSRPSTTRIFCARCCWRASGKKPSPARSTPASPCSTRWAQTSAARPDHRVPGACGPPADLSRTVSRIYPGFHKGSHGGFLLQAASAAAQMTAIRKENTMWTLMTSKRSASLSAPSTRSWHLRPVRDVAPPSLQFHTIHGYRRAFRVAGSGPALLLIHGVGDSSETWEPVMAKLAQRFTVIAPDLLGHGVSDKPRADYSLAAFANGMRDLLAVLDIKRVTVVGHSLGGGIAMQFAYQYPHLVERVVLVGTGGVTKDVSFALRLAAMPMGSEALAVLRVPGVLPALRGFGRAAGTVLGSTKFGRDLPDAMRLLERLQE